ncbi:MAG: PDZ domain-containing protein [Actinomycetota bacterium]
MRRTAGRLLVGAVSLTLLAGSCGGGAGAEGVDPERPASEVEPPPGLDVKRTGLPGLILATNSASLRRVARSPEGEGAVVLFVAPGGPFDGLGVGRGDLITAVGGEDIRSHPRALALLHDRPGKSIEVSIRHRDGRERSIEVEPKEPLVTSLRQYLNPLVGASPRDPVLRFLRAQSPGLYNAKLVDLEEALKLDRRFVEALTLRASLIWDNKPNDQERQPRFVEEALSGWKSALQIDPDNTTTLATRSTVLSTLGSAQQARRDAAKVIELDPTHPRGYYALAVAEDALKRPERAVAPARDAITLDPFNNTYWRLLARLFKDLKRLPDCRRTTAAFAPFLEAQKFDEDADSLKAICR